MRLATLNITDRVGRSTVESGYHSAKCECDCRVIPAGRERYPVKPVRADVNMLSTFPQLMNMTDSNTELLNSYTSLEATRNIVTRGTKKANKLVD